MRIDRLRNVRVVAGLQDADAILSELGYDAADVGRLRELDVV